jgi:hypothetical protein
VARVWVEGFPPTQLGKWLEFPLKAGLSNSRLWARLAFKDGFLL